LHLHKPADIRFCHIAECPRKTGRPDVKPDVAVKGMARTFGYRLRCLSNIVSGKSPMIRDNHHASQ